MRRPPPRAPLPLALLGAGLLVALLSSSAIAAPPASRPYPPDPFAERYRPPEASQVGTAAGQVRLLLAAGSLLIDGPQIGVQATAEFMTFAFLGVRLSTLGTAARLDSAGPATWSWKAGPSLHFLPYRRVDLGLFLEAGPAALDPFGDHSAWAPLLDIGATLDVSLSSFWLLRLEGNLGWGVYERGGEAATYFGPGFLLGVGVQL